MVILSDNLLLSLVILALALLWDIVLGEPRLHPVAGIGKIIAFFDRMAPRRGNAIPFLYGLGMALVIPGGLAVATYFLVRGLLLLHPLAYVIVGAYLLKSCFSVRELTRAAERVRLSLHGGHWEEARGNLKSLVSRDTADLTPNLMASAAVESVAENSTDSFVAPLLAFAFLGLPGVVAYRAINTMDSMIGYFGPYEYLGKASARLDDLVNLVPARLAALLILVAGYLRNVIGGTLTAVKKGAWLLTWQQHSRTSSPNAGWTMGAMAGVLGVELQKVGYYRLGVGPAVTATEIRGAVRTMYGVAAMSVALTVGVLVLRNAIS